jgi:hypothetical protein
LEETAVTPEEALDKLDSLLIEGYLIEKCACGCEKQHHKARPGEGRELGFCWVCYGDRCNRYEPVLYRTNKLAKPAPVLYSKMTRELLRRRGRALPGT